MANPPHLCNVIDHRYATDPPTRCGKPATSTTTDQHGAIVGICVSHEMSAMVLGYELTPATRR
jgi:hypothetical protein